MRFVIPRVDLRRDCGSLSIDDENGELVGQLLMSPGSGDCRRRIILLEKYSGTFATHDECEAFAAGVASVLNHMTSMKK